MIEFDDRIAHRKHMQMIHGSSVYFKDLSTELKIKSTESLYKYLGAPDEVDKMDSLAPDCDCD